jgi:hypothetical protein
LGLLGSTQPRTLAEEIVKGEIKELGESIRKLKARMDFNEKVIRMVGRAITVRLAEDAVAQAKRLAAERGFPTTATTSTARAPSTFAKLVDELTAHGMTEPDALRHVSSEQPALFDDYRNATYVDGPVKLRQPQREPDSALSDEDTRALASATMGIRIAQAKQDRAEIGAQQDARDVANTTSGAYQDPIEQFRVLVAALVKAGMPRDQAEAEVSDDYPDLWASVQNALKAKAAANRPTGAANLSSSLYREHAVRV